MNKKLLKYFTPEAREKIIRAVAEAERQTSGEIVPYIVESSDDYDEAQWRGVSLVLVVTIALLSFWLRYSEMWLPIGCFEIIGISLLLGLISALLIQWVSPLKRLFAGRDLMKRRVELKAAQAFITEEVFKTRERTGVLIYISMMERQVLVVGDSGINAKVKLSDWEEAVSLIIKGIKEKKPVEGIVTAIELCGSLLKKYGVEIRPDDTDELSNAPRIGV
jgi:putative membrane protein